MAIRTTQLTPEEVTRIRGAVAEVGEPTMVRDEFVGPTIGNELRRKALIALGLALAAQLVYLGIRFRWSYAAGAVSAMAHDVIRLLGVFAWLGKTLDGVFLAALLTVIGYSINDSVVVFDRVRELRRARSKDPLRGGQRRLPPDGPTAINTGLGALFILVALYVLGGETLTDFALALLIGIVVGTYSSVFTATPLAVWFEGVRDRPRSEPARRASPPPAPRAPKQAPIEAAPLAPATPPAKPVPVPQPVGRARPRPRKQRRKPAKRR